MTLNKSEIERVSKVNQYVADLKLGKMNGSYEKAFRIIRTLERVILNLEWKCAKDLIKILTLLNEIIFKADPTETLPRNIILRVLKEIRDEYQSAFTNKSKDGFDGEESLPKMMIINDRNCEYDEYVKDLKEVIVDDINELKSELDTSAESIAIKSLEQISSDQVILTLGKSKSVEAFLKYAYKKIKFQVIVAEGGPSCHGRDLVLRLASAGVNTTLIPDSAIFAIMSRVNKVIIGTHSVMANGGLKAVSGAYTLALAAKHYSVPLTVCTSMFKITPDYLITHDQVAFNKLNSPHQVMSFNETPLSTESEIVNPAFDYVPPDLVNGFVTNVGCYSPSYVYRLLSELYHRKDYLL